jgi:predicted enzyme related to lactoylglutathione lyase
MRIYDHIDLRVPDLAKAKAFYETLLPALGFAKRVPVDGWLQFEAAGAEAAAFFGVTHSPGHVPNENRVAFWAQDHAAVDRIAQIVAKAGGRNIEGPMDYEPGYYAVFFEDPCGNRFEVCHRTRL